MTKMTAPTDNKEGICKLMRQGKRRKAAPSEGGNVSEGQSEKEDLFLHEF